MLDKLTSQQFVDDKGQTFEVFKDGAPLTQLELCLVDEHPECKMQQECRTPFSLVFKALNEEIPLDDGCYTLTGSNAEIAGVFVSRIVPPAELGPGAWYQVAFS